MVLQTTVVGSMPKPDYLKIPCWVDAKSNKIDDDYVKQYNEIQNTYTPQQLKSMITKATEEAIELQNEAGISIVTDGEMRRENYIYDFCRRLNGFDFENTVEVVCRNGAWIGHLPQIVGEVSAKEGDSHKKV